MAKRAKKSFVVEGGGQYFTIHPNRVFADAHPLTSTHAAMFESIAEETATALGTPNVTASDITDTTAHVEWDAVAGATLYTVTTSPATETYNVTDTEVDLEELTAETSYTVSVVAKNENPFNTASAAGTDTFDTLAE